MNNEKQIIVNDAADDESTSIKVEAISDSPAKVIEEPASPFMAPVPVTLNYQST